MCCHWFWVNYTFSANDTFVAVAARVVSHPSHELDDAPLEVSFPSCKERQATVCISGITATLSQALLKMFYGKKSKSGGGPVEQIIMMPERHMALVTFVNADGLWEERINCSASVVCLCLLQNFKWFFLASVASRKDWCVWRGLRRRCREKGCRGWEELWGDSIWGWGELCGKV